jgi:glycosyltransferase involved in cell wall biosynthesis
MEEAPTFNEEYYFSFGKESILQPAFWGPLFGNVKLEKLDIAFYPNQIRAALNDYWAYTEWDPVVRTVKRSQYGERINKTLRLDLVSNLNSLNHDVLDLKKELSKVNITSSSNLKVVKERKAINNDNLIIIKFLQIIGLKKLNELIIFKALNDKLKKCVPLNASNKRICCYTYRPRAIEGGRGGGGAVQSAMQQILGDSYKDAKIEYIYSEKDGVWHTLKNKFFTKKRFPKIFPSQTDLMQLWTAMVFIYDKAKDKSGVFITHEIFSAYALALLKKKYVLVLHSQGSKVHEMTALGEKTTAVTRYIINKCEEMALKGAYKVYFPSLGARLSFLKDTNYKGNNISEMPLYNTVYAHPEFVPHETLIRDDNYITLISIGTMTESKGQDQSLKYVKKLASSSDKKIRWLCVGKGPLKNKVVSEANDAMEQYSNLDIIFLEKVPYPTVKYLLSISDIYLMLHRVSIFDLATLEAMETGLMLILSRIGGNLEFNVCNNVKYDDENFNLDANEIEKYKQLSLEAFKTFNNESFKKIYHKVFDDLIG